MTKGYTKVGYKHSICYLTRQFEKVTTSLLPKNGLKLYQEKNVAWIGSKAKTSLGKNANYYAYSEKDFSKLNIVLNSIYQREEALKEKLGVDTIPELEALKRDVVFDLTRENNRKKEDLSKINRDLKVSITEARKEIQEYFKKNEFSIEKCKSLWFDQYEKIKADEKFGDVDGKFLKNYLSFNIAFQYVYDCASNHADLKDGQLLDVIMNTNALASGDYISSFRTDRAYITEGNWRPVDEKEILTKMEILEDWCLNDVKSKELNPIVMAAILNCELIRTQAFNDGNHRTARLVTNAILTREGIPPITINLTKRKEYNVATNEAIENHDIDSVVDIIYNEAFRNAIKISKALDNLEEKYIEENNTPTKKVKKVDDVINK